MRLLGEVILSPFLSIENFDDCKLHECRHEIIKMIENQINKEHYDLILTHSNHDTHYDHIIAAEATISASRDFKGTILQYSVPSTEPNKFQPNFFVAPTESAIEAKEKALEKHKSQRDKSFMKSQYLRGVSAGWAQHTRVKCEFLEAFEIYKTFWLFQEDVLK